MKYAAVVSITLFYALPILGAPMDRREAEAEPAKLFPKPNVYNGPLSVKPKDNWEIMTEQMQKNGELPSNFLAKYRREAEAKQIVPPPNTKSNNGPLGISADKLFQIDQVYPANKWKSGDPPGPAKTYWRHNREAEAEPALPLPNKKFNNGPLGISTHQVNRLPLVDNWKSGDSGRPFDPQWLKQKSGGFPKSKREAEAEADPMVITPDRRPGFQRVPFGRPGLGPFRTPFDGPNNLNPGNPLIPSQNFPRPLQGPGLQNMPGGVFKMGGQGSENKQKKPDGQGPEKEKKPEVQDGEEKGKKPEDQGQPKDGNQKREAEPEPEPEADPKPHHTKAPYKNAGGNMAHGH